MFKNIKTRKNSLQKVKGRKVLWRLLFEFSGPERFCLSYFRCNSQIIFIKLHFEGEFCVQKFEDHSKTKVWLCKIFKKMKKRIIFASQSFPFHSFAMTVPLREHCLIVLVRNETRRDQLLRTTACLVWSGLVPRVPLRRIRDGGRRDCSISFQDGTDIWVIWVQNRKICPESSPQPSLFLISPCIDFYFLALQSPLFRVGMAKDLI